VNRLGNVCSYLIVLNQVHDESPTCLNL
jgi:hypothetical protein